MAQVSNTSTAKLQSTKQSMLLARCQHSRAPENKTHSAAKKTNIHTYRIEKIKKINKNNNKIK